MNGSGNIIRKQMLHFHYNGNTDGIALQKEVSEWCNFNLIPEMEQFLEEFSQDDFYLTIDKIEINAKIDSKNWKQKVKDELMSEFKQTLDDYQPAISQIKKTPEAKIAKLDTLIIFYLKTGFLPWWGKAFLVTDFKTVFKNWVTEEKSTKRVELIREELKHIVSQKVSVRIIEQVPEEYLFIFLKSIYKEHAERIVQFEAFFESVILDKISKEKRKTISKPVYVHLLYSVLKNNGNIEFKSILPLIYNRLAMNKLLPAIIKSKSEEVIGTTSFINQFWKQIVLDEQNKPETKTNMEKPVIQEKLIKEEALNPEKQLEKLLISEMDEEYQNETEAEIQEGIFIDNAGIMIFAVFIPTLFEKLGLTENKKIVNPDLATSLIQFCVSGKSQIEEYELVLPKILCGLDIDFPIDTNIEFNEKQISEVDSMLQSLISHWQALGDTSIESLRETFLNRSGKLRFVDGEWLLVVEQKAYDMLLERIPWSFSIIKLPWMETLLKTEWI